MSDTPQDQAPPEGKNNLKSSPMDPEPTPVVKPVPAEELQQAESSGQDTQAAHAQGQSDLSTAPAPPKWTQALNEGAKDEQEKQAESQQGGEEQDGEPEQDAEKSADPGF